MAVPAKRKSRNIELSINKFIKENFSDVYTYNINFQDSQYDVESLDSWVTINFLSHGAGRLDSTMVQIDLISRVRGKLSAGDRFGSVVEIMADRLHSILHVDTVPIYDFTNPSSPTEIAGAKLMVQNSKGTFREPEDDKFHGFDDGFAWRSLTYRFRLPEDASGSQSFYD